MFVVSILAEAVNPDDPDAHLNHLSPVDIREWEWEIRRNIAVFSFGVSRSR